jgi:hypothetical protein
MAAAGKAVLCHLIKSVSQDCCIFDGGMGQESEKYRAAANAAQRMAALAQDEQAEAKWLEHAAEWTRMAEEAERSGK